MKEESQRKKRRRSDGGRRSVGDEGDSWTSAGRIPPLMILCRAKKNKTNKTQILILRLWHRQCRSALFKEETGIKNAPLFFLLRSLTEWLCKLHSLFTSFTYTEYGVPMEYLWSTYGVSTRFIVVGALATVFFSILILSHFRLSLPVHQKIIGLKSLDEMA